MTDAQPFTPLAQLLLETTGEGILVVDESERITIANPVAARLLGSPAPALVGRTLHGALRSSPADTGPAPDEGCPLCAALAAGKTGRQPDTWLAGDGVSVPVDVVIRPLFHDRTPVGALVIVQDITAHKHAEQEIQRQREALYQREKVAAMGSLLADMAHELNNPLSVIVAGAAILAESDGDEDVRARALQIERAAQRCSLVVKSFLALARQRPAKRELVALNDVVRDVLTLLRYQFHVGDVEVVSRLAANLPTVWGDPNQLNQLVVNLVTNARQAMRAEPLPRGLTLSTRVDAGRSQVVLEVADTGPGVPAALRARIFEPFFTTKPAGEGTGLGLPLCASIVTSHGGSIHVEERPGPGAVFVVRLPIDARVTTSRALPPPAPAARHRGSILVVDDEADIAQILAELLAADGHTVETVADGTAALDEVEQRPYDVILSDMRMPRLDGAGFYRELERRHPELARRVIFVTGDALDAENRRFLERTRASALLKPFDLAQVRSAVQKVLEG